VVKHCPISSSSSATGPLLSTETRAADGLTSESYDSFGDVTSVVQDLAAVADRRRESQRVRVTSEEADLDVSYVGTVSDRAPAPQVGPVVTPLTPGGPAINTSARRLHYAWPRGDTTHCISLDTECPFVSAAPPISFGSAGLLGSCCSDRKFRS
jgi:hypothetical protein